MDCLSPRGLADFSTGAACELGDGAAALRDRELPLAFVDVSEDMTAEPTAQTYFDARTKTKRSGHDLGS